MSRPLVILVAVLVVLVLAAVALASMNTEVAPTLVRKSALPQAPAK